MCIRDREIVAPLLKGAFCLVFLTRDNIIGLRDSFGFHPLVLGSLKDGYVLASEDCAFTTIEAQYLRELNPGEMITIGKDIFEAKQIIPSTRKSLCVFEHVYFARPDSNVFGESVAEIREKIGARLAVEQPAKADIVISVPDSGRFACLLYTSGDPFLEKRIIESCLEIVKKDLILGMQDLGAAGLVSSTSEMASKGNCGIELDLSLVPKEGVNITPREMMLSETQERMILVRCV